MVPHALFVSSDRHVDLALNLLTVLVGGGLLATALWSLFLWLFPTSVADRGDVGPPAWAAMTDALLGPPRIDRPIRLELPAPRLDVELPLPRVGTVYRCEHRGQVTYSDRPCLMGRVRALTIRPS